MIILFVLMAISEVMSNSILNILGQFLIILIGDRTEPPRTCTPWTLTPRTHTLQSLTPWTLTPWTPTPYRSDLQIVDFGSYLLRDTSLLTKLMKIYVICINYFDRLSK